MDILEKIVAYKKGFVEEQKILVPLEQLKSEENYHRTPLSLKAGINQRNGIIAEHKRKSPSKGIIFNGDRLEHIVEGYEKAGVSGISVLTDEFYFGGGLQDLQKARMVVNIPLLRKEFVIDAYQIHEAKSAGADAILLIASILSKKEVEAFTQLAHDLGMEVLFEVHSEEELEKMPPTIDLLGVNNRDLRTFKVDIQTSVTIFAKQSGDYLKVAESGISNPNTINSLRKEGIQGFLIGENFMKEVDPALACIDFCKQLD